MTPTAHPAEGDVVALPAPLPPAGPPRLLRAAPVELWSTGWPALDRALLAVGDPRGRLFAFLGEPLGPEHAVAPAGDSLLPSGVEFCVGFEGVNERARAGPGRVGPHAYELRPRPGALLVVAGPGDLDAFEAEHLAPGGLVRWGLAAGRWAGVLVTHRPRRFGLPGPGGWAWSPAAVRAVDVVHDPRGGAVR